MVNMLIYSMGFKHDFVEYTIDRNIRNSSLHFLKGLRSQLTELFPIHIFP